MPKAASMQAARFEIEPGRYSTNHNDRYWAQLTLTARNLSRVFWIHAKERDGDLGKQDLLAKL